MSCDNSLPISDIVDQVRIALAPEFITQTNPTIVNGVFTTPVLNRPSIRGDILFDADARAALRYAVSPIPQVPINVIGSRSDGTAVASILGALVELGLVTDSTTT